MTVDQARRRKSVARWHRRLALWVALWLSVLAVSGVLINHSNGWGLDRQPLPPFLEQWAYGSVSGRADLCQAVTSTAVNCSRVFARLQLPLGALLLSPDSLFLVDDTGQLLEKLSVGQLGLVSLEAGLAVEADIYLRDAQKTILTNPDLIRRDVIDSAGAMALDEKPWQVRSHQSEAITWERLLLDLHAARFLGPVALIFNDLMALLILVLAASGLRLFLIKRKTSGNGLDSCTKDQH